MPKYRVSAAPREGFDTYHRGGPSGGKYTWPREPSEGRLVELLDSEEDKGEKDGALRIGKATYNRLRADPNIRIVPDGEQGDPGLKAENTRLKGRVAELEGQAESLRARAEAAEHELQAARGGKAGAGDEGKAKDETGKRSGK